MIDMGSEVAATAGDVWDRHPVAVGVAAAVGLLLLVWALRRARDAKLTVGTAIVQGGVTWAVVTGTYAYCAHALGLPEWEAAAFAVFFEAATWVTIGQVIDYGRGTDDQGRPNVGFGPAGPFFWLFSTLGGLLAVAGGDTTGARLGRAVIVVFGTCLWYLTLLRKTRRSGRPSRFRWTPRAALVALGAIEPAEQDITNEHAEWQIRRMARAMRWAGSRWPWSWLGRRALVRRAEQVDGDIIEQARRRYATAHVLVSSTRPDSAVMRRAIESATAALDPGPDTGKQPTPDRAPDRERVTPPPPPPVPNTRSRRDPRPVTLNRTAAMRAAIIDAMREGRTLPRPAELDAMVNPPANGYAKKHYAAWVDEAREQLAAERAGQRVNGAEYAAAGAQ